MHKYAFFPFYLRLPPYKFSIYIVLLIATHPLYMYKVDSSIHDSPHSLTSISFTRTHCTGKEYPMHDERKQTKLWKESSYRDQAKLRSQ